MASVDQQEESPKRQAARISQHDATSPGEDEWRRCDDNWPNGGLHAESDHDAEVPLHDSNDGASISFKIASKTDSFLCL